MRDFLFIVALFVAVVVVGYVLGSRKRKAVAPPAAAPTPAAKKPLPAPAPAKAKATAKDADLVRTEEEDNGEGDGDSSKDGAPKPIIYQPPVIPIIYDEHAEDDEAGRSEVLFLVSATAETDAGLRRKRNEDSLLVLEGPSLFAVADGMGGYQGGELASQLAVKTLNDAFASSLFEGEPHETIPGPASELARAIQMANAAILATAKRKKNLEGMGTTVCAARFSADKKRVYIGHVGDSRCYRLRDGVLTQMTADHTMAEHGVKGPEAAHLSRAVGIWPTVPIDVIMGVPLANDIYLLCSDGLTKMLNDDVIATVLRGEDDLKAAVERLIRFANARGGKDNITVVLIRVVVPDWKPSKSMPDPTEAMPDDARPDAPEPEAVNATNANANDAKATNANANDVSARDANTKNAKGEGAKPKGAKV